MIATLPIWVMITQALAIPVIAASAALIAAANLRLGYLKRKDDLFDRRYRLLEESLAIVDNPFDGKGRDFKVGETDISEYFEVEDSRLRSTSNRASLLFSNEFAIALRQAILKEIKDRENFMDSNLLIHQLFESEMR